MQRNIYNSIKRFWSRNDLIADRKLDGEVDGEVTEISADLNRTLLEFRKIIENRPMILAELMKH